MERAELLAKEMDQRRHKADRFGKSKAKLTAIEGWAFARWIGDISYENGEITKVEILYLD